MSEAPPQPASAMQAAASAALAALVGSSRGLASFVEGCNYINTPSPVDCYGLCDTFRAALTPAPACPAPR